MKIILLFVLCGSLANQLMAQTICSGDKIFNEKKCRGDELSLVEQELFKLVNDYRAQNQLPPVPLSAELSIVANRHLLDLTNNIGKLTHSWSNCAYEVNDSKTWDCIFDSPKRLGTGYRGRGFENLYRNLNKEATPAAALEAWKKSPPHNGLILNLDVWKSTKFDAFGVAIEGNWAAIWFGAKGARDINLNRPIKGLGITFEKLVSGLDKILNIEKTDSVLDNDKWIGRSVDKTIQLEIYGNEKDVNETSMSLSVKLNARSQLSQQSRQALLIFLKNLSPNWLGREKWFNDSLIKLSKAPKSVQTVTEQNKVFEMRIGADKSLQITVKPNSKPQASEF